MRHLAHLAAFFLIASCRLAAQPPLPDSLYLTGTIADTSVAVRLMGEARILVNAGKNKEATDKLDQAQAIVQYTVGEESLLAARCFYLIGGVCMFRGDFDQADQHYRLALRAFKHTLGDHPSVCLLLVRMGQNCRFRKDLDGAIVWYLQSAAMVERLKWFYPDPWLELGSTYQEKGDDRNALLYSEAIFELARKFRKPADGDLGLCHHQVALACGNLGEYDRAIEHYLKALHIAEEKLPDTGLYLLQLLNEIGYAHNETGDYDRALDCFQKALAGYQSTLDTTGITISLSEMGRAHTAKGDYDRALNVLHQAEIFVDQYPVELEAAGCYQYLGYALALKDKKPEAIFQFRKSLEIKIKNQGEHSLDLLGPLINLGTLLAPDDYPAAERYFQQALEVCEKNPLAEHPNIAVAFNDYADCLQKQGQFEQADSMYQRAWHYFRYTDTASLSQVRGLNHLLTSLYQRGNFYRRWHQRTGRPELLELALSTFDAFEEAVRHQRQRLSDGSKSSLSEQARPGYEGAISTWLLRWRESGDQAALRRAFDFSEKARSLQLFEALRKAEAQQFASIPDSLLQREHVLRVDMAYWEKRYNELIFDQKKAETDATTLSFSNRAAELRRQYEALQQQFEHDYPDYFRLKYDLRTATAAYVQDTLLQPGQTLLEYFVGDSSIYLFAVRPDTLLVLDIQRDFPLDTLIAQMRSGLLGGQYENSDPRYWPAVGRYAAAAQALYHRLVAPATGLLSGHLVIVPDGTLATVPFEALLTGPPPKVATRFAQYPYLLRQRTISYCYSATLLREMKACLRASVSAPTSILLAMAPFSQSGYTTLQPVTREVLNPKLLSVLPATGPEVSAIYKVWGSNGSVLLDREATKTAFEKKAGQCRILHLATHGKADHRSSDFSYLAFAAQKDTLALLHVRDIYNLSIQADLVVLSACETGLGRIRRSEGVVSLARAFAYAGSKSLVTTLWSADDNGSKNLMVEFHRQLQAGQSKSTALQKTKIRLLETSDPHCRHPFYWAGFVIIGDEGRIGF